MSLIFGTLDFALGPGPIKKLSMEKINIEKKVLNLQHKKTLICQPPNRKVEKNRVTSNKLIMSFFNSTSFENSTNTTTEFFEEEIHEDDEDFFTL